MTYNPRQFKVALVVPRDVIEVDGQPWRVVTTSTGKKTRTFALKHAHYPNRTRTIRRYRDAEIRMLDSHVPGLVAN